MKKRFTKSIVALFTIAALTMGMATTVSAQWVQSTDGRWWNEKLDSTPEWSVGWELIGGSWYLFDQNGYMLTGWQVENSTWYFMNPSGHMMKDTWIDGKYYVGSNGAMLVNSQTPDGYYVGGNGAWIPGYQPGSHDGSWKKDNNGWWWEYNTGGWPKNEWKLVNDEWYFFATNGYMLENEWLESGDARSYYFGSDGAMLNACWAVIGGNHFYFNGSDTSYGYKEGEMLHSTWVKTSGKHYYLAADGHMVTDTWIHNTDGSDYYVGADGALDKDKKNDEDITAAFKNHYIGDTARYRWECNYRANGRNTAYYVHFKSITGDQVTMNLEHIDKNTGEKVHQENIIGTLKGNTVTFTFKDGRDTGTGTISLNEDNVYVVATCKKEQSTHTGLSLCTGGAKCTWIQYK